MSSNSLWKLKFHSKVLIDKSEIQVGAQIHGLDVISYLLGVNGVLCPY